MEYLEVTLPQAHHLFGESYRLQVSKLTTGWRVVPSLIGFVVVLWFINLITEKGTPPSVLLEILIESYRRCCSSIAFFYLLVRDCTQTRTTEGAYDVIYNLRSWGCFNTIHRNRFFWLHMNTFNLVIYALCKECQLVEAI
ncbi:hypothetical protein Ahy_A04g020638 [Arachis hypogaea]|uniref:Uncharacterized protein n=1 Tax=Arachis hypogaea TaxID=3818 RepID=A0A445DI67_ARAHY|nr:hypothetical protein Ahy_A04g020638 [Arachis hypogaea]